MTDDLTIETGVDFTGVIRLTDAQLVNLLAAVWCQFDHDHDIDTCIPHWVQLGED